MDEVKVVVGANYGDEGKGLATRFFTLQALGRGHACLNVLYNGSSQRGHTAELPSGQRHVFHHFGSGTLDGAVTFFHKDFMVNPATFVQEYEQLEELGIQPKCFVADECRVVTPFDMMINQVVENSRGDERHGSCGVGVWETQQRYAQSRFNLSFGQMKVLSNQRLYQYLYEMAQTYVPSRLLEYKIGVANPLVALGAGLATFIQHFINDFRYMEAKATAVNDDTIDDMYRRYDTVIFEAGQGLALDENNIAMRPHVTASKTGSQVPVQIALPRAKHIEVCYVTRSYLTRHGAGPLPTECPPNEIGIEDIDQTNIDNEFQGSIRYGHMDYRDLTYRMEADRMANNSDSSRLSYSVMMTHGNVPCVGSHKLLLLLRSPVCDHLYLSSTKFAEDVQDKQELVDNGRKNR